MDSFYSAKNNSMQMNRKSRTFMAAPIKNKVYIIYAWGIDDVRGRGKLF